MNTTLVEMLREPEATAGGELVECGFCHAMVDEAELCSKCGEHLKNPTMADWGKRLPLGIEEGGRLNKDFDLVPLSWKLERDIGRAWENKRDRVTLGEHVTSILAHAVTRLGSADITKHSVTKKQLIFNQMYAGDVLYMYAYLRLVSLGKELRLRELVCERCRHKFDFVADVTSLEIMVRERAEHLRVPLKLRDGFKMAGDQRKKLTLRPNTWSMMDAHFSADNLAETFSRIVLSSVVGVEGLPEGSVVTEREIEQLTKYDMALFEQALDQVMGGPRWDIQGECPSCKSSFSILLDWSYQNFFSISYRSPQLMRR